MYHLDSHVQPVKEQWKRAWLFPRPELFEMRKGGIEVLPFANYFSLHLHCRVNFKFWKVEFWINKNSIRCAPAKENYDINIDLLQKCTWNSDHYHGSIQIPKSIDVEIMRRIRNSIECSNTLNLEDTTIKLLGKRKNLHTCRCKDTWINYQIIFVVRCLTPLLLKVFK